MEKEEFNMEEIRKRRNRVKEEMKGNTEPANTSFLWVEEIPDTLKRKRATKKQRKRKTERV